MIPKKSNTLYKQIAENFDLPESFVENCVEFYYKRLRQKLTDLKEPRINIEKLGQFVIKKTVVAKQILKLEGQKDIHDLSTFSGYFHKKLSDEKLEKLKAVKEKIDKADEEKKQFIENKYGKVD